MYCNVCVRCYTVMVIKIMNKANKALASTLYSRLFKSVKIEKRYRKKNVTAETISGMIDYLQTKRNHEANNI